MEVTKPIVAVVDDDAGMRASIASLLKSAGHASVLFSSADEFVEAGPPLEMKCLVLDVKMPGMDGLQLQRLMKSRRPNLPVIFVSAHCEEGIRISALTEGTVTFFPKPFDSEELLRAVGECVTLNTAHALNAEALNADALSHDTRPPVTAGDDERGERMRIVKKQYDPIPQEPFGASTQHEDSPVQDSMTRAIDSMRTAIDEGRRAVCGLHSNQSPSPASQSPVSHSPVSNFPVSPSAEVAELFAQIRDDLMQFRQPGERPNLRIVREGAGKPVRGTVQDEVYRIGREALINAMLHAGAKNIEMKVRYDSDSFFLTVRDDGRGIDPKLVPAGRYEHWGLSGMRERAEHIGARLRIWSAPGRGTELELKISAAVAFAN